MNVSPTHTDGKHREAARYFEKLYSEIMHVMGAHEASIMTLLFAWFASSQPWHMYMRLPFPGVGQAD